MQGEICVECTPNRKTNEANVSSPLTASLATLVLNSADYFLVRFAHESLLAVVIPSSLALAFLGSSSFRGTNASLMPRMNEMEMKKAQLKRMYADVQLRADVVQKTFEKKWQGRLSVLKWQKKQC